MQTSLLRHLMARGHQGSLVDHVLPRMIAALGTDFAVFADCGAGVGYTTGQYAQMLQAGLGDRAGAAQILAFEPLPENIAEITPRIADQPMIRLRPVAVGARAGQQDFTIPRRMTGTGEYWGGGTSALGYLGRTEGAEVITVPVVRLADEDVSHFDFVKLDLQGGERAALQGLGDKLDLAKIVYAEHQMFAPTSNQALQLLSQAGFVCQIDRLLFGLRHSAPEVPLALLAEAGITVDRIQPPDGRNMSLNYVLNGHIDIDRTRHLSPTGALSPEMAQKLQAAGIYYIATDILAVHHKFHHRLLEIL